MIKLKMEQQKKDFEQTFRTLKKEANQLELRQNVSSLLALVFFLSEFDIFN